MATRFYKRAPSYLEEPLTARTVICNLLIKLPQRASDFTDQADTSTGFPGRAATRCSYAQSSDFTIYALGSTLTQHKAQSP